MKLRTLLLSGLFGATCGLSIAGPSAQANRNAYPAHVVRSFINGCIASGATASTCNCVLDKIQSRYSLQQFIQLEMQVRSSRRLPPDVVNMMVSCVRR
jgi:hypothetical protein